TQARRTAGGCTSSASSAPAGEPLSRRAGRGSGVSSRRLSPPAPTERAAVPYGDRAGRCCPMPEPVDLDLLLRSLVVYAIFMLDPGGRLLSWNPDAERIKGYSAERIAGRHFSVLYPPEDAAAGRPGQALAAAAAEGRFEDEGWRVREDGTRFWANVVITALRDGEG